MPRKFVISPTKLRIWNRCHAEYRLEYIDKIGKFYHRARAGFAFGHSLHRVLETFHAAGGVETVNAETLSASLDAAWVAKGYAGEAQETEFKQEAARILTDYHAAQVVQAETAKAEAVRKGEPAPEPPRLFLAEKALRMDLTPDIALTGRVDRVDEHPALDNALEIVDYKSGRTEVTPEDVSGAVAMNTYQAILKVKNPDRRVFATIVALRSGASASHEMSNDEREAFLADTTETGETIRTKDWENVLPVVNAHCPYCDFLPHCEKFWAREKRRQH
ncbi:MAG: PD-(D/E)XK nuclease family protein [Armatimonadetes bacterium]|nr:PD-(D/E)XK nuclease family protein [Armatimonadota bacterium]